MQLALAIENRKLQGNREKQDLSMQFSRKMKFLIFFVRPKVFFAGESRFWPNGDENPQTTHRSNRFFLRSANMESISTINHYTGQIEGKEKTATEPKSQELTQFLTKLQIITGYVIYNLYSTQSLTQLKLLHDAKSNLFLDDSCDAVAISGLKM